jgi:N-acetylmuramoyl-L-alanine amidase
MRVALIVGHSEDKQGAVGREPNGGTVTEFKFNTKLVNLVAPLISRFCECKVIYREKSISEVVEKVNELSPHVAFSFHANAFNGRASGSETVYYCYSYLGERVAAIMLSRIVSALGLKDRGTKGKAGRSRGVPLLKGTKCPTVILEPFFIDNPKDFEVATNRFADLITELVKGIKESLKFLKKEEENV